MSKRFWGINAIIFGALIIAAIIYFFFFYKPAAVPEPVAETPTNAGAKLTPEPEPTETVEEPLEPAAPLKKAEVKADDLARLGSAFAERFGSFSNQSDYGNLRDLQIFMTAGMKAWAENYINTARLKKTDASIYYGIVTKAVLSETKIFDPDLGRAEILVKTQRRESTGISGNSSTFYQDLLIKYRREGTVWRVDAAYWQSR